MYYLGSGHLQGNIESVLLFSALLPKGVLFKNTLCSSIFCLLRRVCEIIANLLAENETTQAVCSQATQLGSLFSFCQPGMLTFMPTNAHCSGAEAAARLLTPCLGRKDCFTT